MKATNTEAGDFFGISVAITRDSVVVGTFGDDSHAIGINGDPNNNLAEDAGAVHVFRHFSINAGLNDAWVNSETPFQGMFITVFPALKLVFLAWFTFDSVPTDPGTMSTFGAPDQRWVTALGYYNGNSVEMKAELTTGGRFNTSDPLPVQDSEYGTINVEFSSCETGNIEFDFPSVGASGSFNIQRVVNSNVELCEVLNSE